MGTNKKKTKDKQKDKRAMKQGRPTEKKTRRGQDLEYRELKKFKTISEKAGYGIAMRAVSGEYIYVNEAYAKMHGFKTEEILGKGLSLTHRPNEIEYIEDLRKQRGDGYIAEITHRRSDGTLFPALVTGSTIKDEEGRPLYYSATVMDITDLKQTEDALRKHKHRIELILQTAMDGFYIIDIEGKIIDANLAAQQITGYDRKELVGNDIRDFEASEDESETMDNARQVVKKGFHRFEIKHRHKSGRVMDLEFSTNYIQIDEERFFFAFFRDVTEMKKTAHALETREEELEMKNLELEEMNAALKVLLKKRDLDKIEMEENLLTNVKELIEPNLERLKNLASGKRQLAYLHILEGNLKNIISPFVRRLNSKYLSLSSTEIQVANFVKEGKTSKEISMLMNLSCRTVEFHRDNIRKKIGIKNKKANLRTFLKSLS